MGFTLQQMAGAYINYIKQQMQSVKREIDEKKQLLSQLETHLQECMNTHNMNNNVSNQNQNDSEVQKLQTNKPITGPIVRQNNDFNMTETIKLPNPFEQLGIQ